MEKINLYEITQEFDALFELIEMDEGEITEAHEELEERCQVLLKTKTDGIAHVYNKLDDEIELADKHIKKLQAYKKARQNSKERLTSWVKFNLEKMEIDKLQGEMFELKFRKPSKVVEIEDADKLPASLVTVKYESTPDKKAIKKLLSEGEEVPGAKLSEGKTSVSIKLKSVK